MNKQKNEQETYEPPSAMIKAANVFFYLVTICLTATMFVLAAGLWE